MMNKWMRANYQPVLPLGMNGTRITGCDEHIELSRKAACEGTVLLKNNNHILPLDKDAPIAVFGKAQIDYIKGGSGSGEVNSAYVRNIYDGLRLKGAAVYDELSLYYQSYVRSYNKTVEGSIILNAKNAPADIDEAPVPADILKRAAEYTDTAIAVIGRYSGENADHSAEDDYFGLSAAEKAMIDCVCESFEHVIILLNAGTMIDASWFAENDSIEAALMIWQGGMEGGLAAADVLFGDENPSGKLVDTCAVSLDDYPSTAGFHESKDYVEYTEDIFVGYRYFETVPGKKDRVIYPFGYGLSYTDFELSNLRACDDGERVFVSADVKNAGSRAGKEVVQVYYSAPEGKITKPAKELCAFGKTKLLEAGESQTVTMIFNIGDMASYDDTGSAAKSAWVMERGEYRIFVGTSVRNAVETDYRYVLEENRITQQLSEYCAPTRLSRRMLSDGSYTEVASVGRAGKVFKNEYKIGKKSEAELKLEDVASGKISLDEFIACLDADRLAELVIGVPNTGVANTFGFGGKSRDDKNGIPPMMTTDGPAGVRIHDCCGISTTAFPIATMLACTWNLELVEEIGRAGALEAKENNLFAWLTPGMNIHRNPLCGRNFEYFSEDPFISGKMAAAAVRGIQSQRVAATPKHFCCNNKETNRMESDSIVSERALREIYLKGFEICVKEADPKLIMTSYNIMNGIHPSENAELLTGILRGEWGYKGIVTTDWWNSADHIAEIKAGNDIRMPEGSSETVKTALRDGVLDIGELAACAKRILDVTLWFE